MRVDLPERVEPSRIMEHPNFESGNWIVSIFCSGMGLAAAGRVSPVGSDGIASGCVFLGGI